MSDEGVSVQGGFTIFLKIAVCYPVTVSLTWLLHLETELPIILLPKQRQPCALRDICCINIQFRKCQTPGPQTVNCNQLTSKLTCKVVLGQEDRIKKNDFNASGIPYVTHLQAVMKMVYIASIDLLNS